MRLAFFVHDLRPENRRLMPWRTLLEVARRVRPLGHESQIFSLARDPSDEVMTLGEERVRVVSKDPVGFARAFGGSPGAEPPYDVAFWPLSWATSSPGPREPSGVASSFVWYIPGAHYRLRHVLGALPHLGPRLSLPYLAQALFPPRLWARGLRSAGEHPLITMTDYSADRAVMAGYPSDLTETIFPGRSERPPRSGPSARVDRIWNEIGDDPVFLFFGPPLEIRGVNFLLSAFQELTKMNEGARLLCLFREDRLGISAEMRKTIAGLDLGDRLICIWDSLEEGELVECIHRSHVVALPFLLVPSEIPLSVIEAAGLGKPVITTGPGGTGQFVSRYGAQVPPGDVRALANAMLRFLEEPDYYAERSDAARSAFARHPTWDQVAEAWVAMAERA